MNTTFTLKWYEAIKARPNRAGPGLVVNAEESVEDLAERGDVVQTVEYDDAR